MNGLGGLGKTPGLEITFREIQQIWLTGGGANTMGILMWFEQIVDRWGRLGIEAQLVGELRLMGDDPGGRWEVSTGGTYLVADAESPPTQDDFQWDAQWSLVTVQDPETGKLVIIDGNTRALRLYAALKEGEISQDFQVDVVIGRLIDWGVRVGKATSPLWR